LAGSRKDATPAQHPAVKIDSKGEDLEEKMRKICDNMLRLSSCNLKIAQ
jgi:hypothetical protein